ncbi:hypothetical protein DXV75_05510 [Alteromonas aestuariivivens]|uniref:Peptidoglycan-binding protein CsiV n=1 Tax=Alteromonas aestuariivivens TaxID=1938339 RepID=A0A3D8MBT4_9ALTE|nr:CsiV family protein [Alteromonas aestuariivivens]RDV27486.1 hypothetical protein DXV75_05510 [Alteromonas aestuariivivens]
MNKNKHTLDMKHFIAGFSMLLFGSGVAPAVSAAEDWWFDVEVILFERDASISQLQEQFSYAPSLDPVSTDWDLITNLLQPDISWLNQGLKDCSPTSALQANNLLKVKGDFSSDFSSSRNLSSQTAAQSLSAPNGLQEAPFELSDTDIAEYWLEFVAPISQHSVSIPKVGECDPNSAWLSWDENGWHKETPNNLLPYPDRLQVVLEGELLENEDRPHILPSDAQELEKLSQQIRWAKGITRMLHVVWRQPVVFGQSNAKSVRLFAGQNYQRQFDLNGRPIAPVEQQSDPATEPTEQPSLTVQTDFFDQLEEQLNTAQPISLEEVLDTPELSAGEEPPVTRLAYQNSGTAIWQLDGYLKVFLKNINQVPYLHIDSELFYRQPVPADSPQHGSQPEYQLVSVPFKQIRRVISNQLHYFDHPLFGMVVQIRRYQLPEEFD